MGDLILNNVESLAYQRNFNYLGDIINFNSTDIYSLRSRIKGVGDVEYSSAPLWTGIKNFSKTGLAYYGFIIDGVNLGTGKITSFNWDEGTDVVDKKFSMSFEIPSSGNFINVSGLRYSDIDKSIFSGNFKYVTDFQESISLSMSSSKIQEMSQDVSFGIDGPLSSTEKIILKNKIYEGFAANRLPALATRGLYPSIISGDLNSGYISNYSEIIDSVNSSYSFSKKSSYDNDNKATWQYSHSFLFNGNDSIVQENGSIKSIYFKGLSGYRNLSGARDRWAGTKTGIYSRVSQTFSLMSGFSGLFNTGCWHDLINYPTERSIEEDPMAGTINYTYSYSNNDSIKTSGYIFSNSRTFQVSEKGFSIINEDGQFEGMSSDSPTRFNNALSGYNQNEPLSISRISGTFLLGKRLSDFSCSLNSGYKKILEDTTYREYDGVVSYSKSYSDDPSYYLDNNNFIKYENSITDSQPVHLHNKFLIPGADEYIQDSDQSTEGSWTNNIKIIGKRGVSIDSYLSESYSKVIRPTGSGMSDDFLKNMNYSFNPFENRFEATFEYYYSKYKESNNYLI